jgi:exopolysaccharide biosynthesis polyprenyl glycosylphosphotransferase
VSRSSLASTEAPASAASVIGAVTKTGPPERLLADPPITRSVAVRGPCLLDPRVWARVRLGVDVLVLCAATVVALLAMASSHIDTADAWVAVSFPVIVLTTIHARRSPDDRLHGSVLDTTVHVLGVVSLAGMATIAVYDLTGTPHAVGVTLRLWLLTTLYMSVARVALLVIRRRAARETALARPTLIVGAGEVGESLVRRLVSEPAYGLRPVGLIDADPLPRGGRSTVVGVPILDDPTGFRDAVERTGARHVIVAFSSEPDHVLVRKVRECEQLGVGVSLVPRLYESINDRSTLDHVGGLPLVTLHPTNPRGWQFALKHAFDRAFAAVALVCLAPLMAAIAVAVRLSSPGPILFRQLRVGRDGREFDVLKFRTMRTEPDRELAFDLPPGLAPGGVEGYDRRTRVGRLLRGRSLDELPQLINVLRGDMSLVGPRPERPEFVALFARDIARYEDRHRVKSGISGLSQVRGLRGQTSIAERVELDNYYIQNWSLGLDLRIMLLTVAEVLRSRE